VARCRLELEVLDMDRELVGQGVGKVSVEGLGSGPAEEVERLFAASQAETVLDERRAAAKVDEGDGCPELRCQLHVDGRPLEVDIPEGVALRRDSRLGAAGLSGERRGRESP
jgi:hypothetical protein